MIVVLKETDKKNIQLNHSHVFNWQESWEGSLKLKVLQSCAANIGSIFTIAF